MSDLDRMRIEMAALSGKSGKKRNPSERVPDTSLKKLNQRAARKRSKQKGSAFERKVAKMFEAWCGWKVKRTPQSGGWSSAAFGVTGDLVCEKKRFPFHIECKNREDWQLDDLITGVRASDSRSIIEWWKQTVTTCPKKKEPLLVFKRNSKVPLVMVRERWLARITGELLGHPVDHMRVDNYRQSMSLVPQFLTTLHALPDPDTVVIMRLDLFLAAEPQPRRKEKK